MEKKGERNNIGAEVKIAGRQKIQAKKQEFITANTANLSASGITETKAIPEKTVKNTKITFVKLQNNYLQAQKNENAKYKAIITERRIRESINSASRRNFGAFIKGFLIFLGVLIFLLGLALLGGGIYFLIYAATTPTATSATLSFGLSLIGYGCLIIGLCTSIFHLAK